MRHAVVLMRGPGDKAQHDGQCASYSVIGRRGWTIVTLPDGTDVSWRTRHWAPAPAAAQRGRLMALGAGLLNVPGLLLGGLRSCTRRLGMARPGVGARRRAWEASCACARSLLLMAVAVLACMGYLLTTIFTVLGYLAAGGWQLVRLAPAIGRAILLAMATLDFEWCTLLVNRKAQQATTFINASGCALRDVGVALRMLAKAVGGTSVKVEGSTLEPPPPHPVPATAAPSAAASSPLPRRHRASLLYRPVDIDVTVPSEREPLQSRAPEPLQSVTPEPEPLQSAMPEPLQSAEPSVQQAAEPTPQRTAPRVATPLSPSPLADEPTRGVAGVCRAASGKSPDEAILSLLSPSRPAAPPPPPRTRTCPSRSSTGVRGLCQLPALSREQVCGVYQCVLDRLAAATKRDFEGLGPACESGYGSESPRHWPPPLAAYQPPMWLVSDVRAWLPKVVPPAHYHESLLSYLRC